MNKTNIFAMALEALTELAPEIHAANADVSPVLPTLADILADGSSLPRGALFLGLADDGLPVLLNLLDPVPGPLLVCADSGKTALLKIVAKAIGEVHNAEDVQFGVVSARPEEWDGFDATENCVGIYPIEDESAAGLLVSLAEWAHGNKSQQAIVLLVDDLARVDDLAPEAKDALRWLLLRGPSRRVWPIVTLNPSDSKGLAAWLELFRTRIFGAMKNAWSVETILGAAREEVEALIAGSQFILREGRNWLRFWIPRLDEGESE